MTCEQLREEYGVWALGCAEEPAQSEIAAHLARKCPECTAGVRSAMATVATLSGAVKDETPSRNLRRRIVEMVQPERKGLFAFVPWAAAAALAVALIVVTMNRQLAAPSPDTTKLAEALTILNDPIAKEVTFGDPAARGRVFVGSQGVVLIAAHMPKLDAAHTFELWLIPGAGNPIPAGTFHSAPDASAVYVHSGQTAGAAAVAVTVEPEGGSAQPTTTPFIVTKL